MQAVRYLNGHKCEEIEANDNSSSSSNKNKRPPPTAGPNTEHNTQKIFWTFMYAKRQGG
jgi:hypothetical protein